MSDDPAARMQAQAAQDQAQKDQARARQHAESAEKANAERPGAKPAPAYDHSNLKDLYQVKLDSRAGETRQAAQDAKQGDKPPGNKAQEHGLSRDRPLPTEAHPESRDRTARLGDRSGPDHSNLGELPKLGYPLQWPEDQITPSPEKLPKLGLGFRWPEGQVTTSRASDAERIQDSGRKMERIAGTRPDREAPGRGGPFVEQTPIQRLIDALKDISAHARDKSADFADMCDLVEPLYMRQDLHPQGSTYVIRGAELREAGLSQQDISALDKTLRENGFAPEGQQRADYAISPADPSQSWLYKGLTEEEADYQVAANAAGKEARKWNQVAEIVWALAGAAAGIAEARGSRPEPEPERAPTYEPHTGAYKPAAPEYGGLLPYEEGAQQEAQSARMAGEPEPARNPTRVGGEKTSPGQRPGERMNPQAWINEYLRYTPGNREITETTVNGFTYIFDSTTRPGPREAENRLVAVYGVSGQATGPRDANRMRGHPNEYGVDRGHAVAHSMGGGTDINLIPQNPELNRGHSVEGKAWRAIETELAKNPGTDFFVRPIYGDNSAYPARLEYGTRQPSGPWHVKSFDNRP